jgi:hypothetical protein
MLLSAGEKNVSKRPSGNIFKLFFVVSILISQLYVCGILFNKIYTAYASPFPSAFSAWNYRKAITISSGSSLTAYQVKLTLDTSALVPSKMQATTCADMRFTQSDGTTAIPYWIESGCGTNATVVWIKADVASPSTTVYMYYGNSAVSSISNGNNVFDFFDDFSGDLSKWAGDTSAFSVVGGELNNTPTSTAKVIYANTSLTGEIIDANIKTTNASTDLQFGLGYRIDSSNRAYFCRRNTAQWGIRGWGDGAVYYSNYPANGSAQWTSGTYGIDSVIVGTTVANSVHKFNGTSVPNVANFNVDINPGISIYSNGSGTPGVQYVDWVRTRQYTVSEPTSSAGAEDANTSPVVSYFAVTGTSSSQAAGGAQIITITATGVLGNTAAGYTGDHVITFSGANSVGNNAPTCADKTGVDVAFGTGTTLTFTNGVATCTMKLYKAETAAINATEGTYNSSGHTLGVTVSAGQFNTFNVTAPSATLVNTPFSMTLAPRDQYGNITSLAGGDLSFSVDHGGSISPSSVSASHFQIVGPDSNAYAYEKDISITSVSSLTDYQVKLTLDTSNVSQKTTCNDIRFAGAGNVNIPYWYDSGCGTANTIVWIKTSLSASPAANTIYWYYGNNTVGSAADKTTFDFYDGFDTGTTVDSTKWNTNGSPPPVSGGYVNFARTISQNQEQNILSKTNFDPNAIVVDMKMRLNTYSGQLERLFFGFVPLASINDDGGSPVGMGGAFKADNYHSTTPNRLYAYYSTDYVSYTFPANGTDFQVSFYNKNANRLTTVLGSTSVDAAVGHTDSGQIFLGGYAISGSVDWIRARKYTANEPTVTVTNTSTYSLSSYTGNFTISGVVPPVSVNVGIQNTNVNQAQAILVDKIDHFNIIGSNNQNTGATQQLTITAIGSLGTVVAGYSGDKSITFSGANSIGSYVPTCTDKTGTNDVNFGTGTTLTFTNGVATCNMKLYKAETAHISATDGTIPTTTTLDVAVSSNVSVYNITAPSLMTAGTPAQITISATDAYGNGSTSYSGIKTITITGPRNIGSNYPTCSDKDGNDVRISQGVQLNFSSGTASCNLKLYKAETATLAATDGTYSASSSPVTVAALPVGSFNVVSPSTVEVNKSFSMNISGNDQYGNIAGISGSTTISTNSGSISPGSLLGTDFKVMGPDSNLYSYENYITIANNLASQDLNAYQVKLVLDTRNVLQASTCNDMRFAETDGTNIPYWYESGCGTTNTIVWIKTSIPRSTTKTVYFYYGNDTVASEANGNNVFLKFSDANDAASWTGYGMVKTGSNELHMSGSGMWVSTLPISVSYPWVIETKLRYTNAVSNSNVYIDIGNGSGSSWAVARNMEVGCDANSTNFAYYSGGIFPTFYSSYAINTNYINKFTEVGPGNYNTALYDSSRNLLGSANGISYATGEVNPVTSFQVGSGSPSWNSDIYIGWVFIRKYVSQEPTVTPGGVLNNASTYNGNFTISGVSHSGNVTVGFLNGSATKNVTIYVDTADHFNITGTSSMAAGATQVLTVSAKGGSGNTFTGYTGDHNITITGPHTIGSYVPTCTDKTGAAVPLGTGTTLNFTNGVATCTLQLVGANDGTSYATGHTLNVAVSSSVSSFGLSFPSSVIAGSSNSVTLTAQDNYGNGATNYTGNHDITFSGASSMGGNNPSCTNNAGIDKAFGQVTALNFVSGVATCNLKLYKAETPTITASDGTYSATGSVVVSPAAINSFDIAAPTSTTSGVPFNLTLIAKDIYGNVTTDVTNSTSISVNHGTINGSNIPASSFQSFIGPDANTYSYEKDISIAYSGSQDFSSGYQVKLVINTQALINAHQMQDTCNDMRFSETDGTNIPYWIESGCNTASTVVWVKTNLVHSASKTIFFYYGNNAVSSAVSGSNVFDFFDDFNSGLGKWNTNGTSPSLSGGYATFDQVSSRTQNLTSKTSFDTAGITMGMKIHLNNVNNQRMYYGFGSISSDGNGTGCVYAGSMNRLYAYYGTDYSAYTFPAYGTDFNVYFHNLAGNLLSTTVGSTTVNSAAGHTNSGQIFLGGDNLGASIDWVYAREYSSSEPVAAVHTTSTGGMHTFNVTISGIIQDTPVTLTVKNGDGISQDMSILVHGVDEMGYFVITGAGTQTAGGSQQITITAFGKSGNPYVLYSGDHAMIFSGANLAPNSAVPTCSNNAATDKAFGQATTLTFTGGVATCNLKLYNRENANISTSDGTYNADSNPLGINVSAASLSSFDLSTPATATSAQPFTLSVVAKDQYGNLTSNISGSTAVTVDHGTVFPTSIGSGEFVNGTYTNDNAVISQIYTTIPVSLRVTNNTVTKSASITVTGVDVVDHLSLTGSASQVAGVAQNVTITAIGKSGNAYPGYSGDKNFTFSGASSIGSFNPTCTDKSSSAVNFTSGTNLTFTSGVAHSSMILYKAESITVTANDGSLSAGLPVTVSAAAVASFIVDAPDTATSAQPFYMNITAKDAYTNTSRTVGTNPTITTGRGSINPSFVNKNNFSSNGSYGTNYTISQVYTSGDALITVTSGSATGNDTVHVTGVDNMNHFAVTGQNAQTAGATQLLTITAIGDSGTTYTGYSGVYPITFSGPTSIGSFTPTCTDKDGNQVSIGTATNLNFTNGVATCTLRVYKKENVATIGAAGGGYSASGYSIGLNVSAASVDHFDVTIPSSITSGNVFYLGLVAKDPYNNITTNISGDTTLMTDSGTFTPAVLDAAAFQTNGSYSNDSTLISNVYVDTPSVNFTIANSDEGLSQTQQLNILGLDEMDHFNITGPSGNLTAGTNQSITMTAIGKSGNTYPNYTGDKHVIFSGANSVSSFNPTGTDKTGAAVAFGQDTVVHFTSGVATSTVKLYKAENGISVNVAEGTYNATGHTPTVNVVPSAVSSFDITAPNNVASSVPFTMTLVAKDAYTNITKNVSNAVALSVNYGSIAPSSIAAANFQSSGTYLMNGSNSPVISQIYTDTQVTLTVATTGASSTKNINVAGLDAMTHFGVTGTTSSIIAGDTQTITISALGGSGNVYTGYSDDHLITLSGPTSIGFFIPTCADKDGNQVAIGTATNLRFTNGVATCTLRMYKAESAIINVQESSFNANGHTFTINVSAGPMVKFALSIPSSATSEEPFSMTLVAKDQFDNTTANVSNTTNLSVNSGTIAPSSVSASDFAGDGIYTLGATISGIPVDQDVRIMLRNGLMAQTEDIHVDGVDVMGHFNITGPTAMIAGQGQQVTITAIGASGDTFTDYGGLNNIRFSGSASIAGFNPTCNNIAFGTNTPLNFTNGVATCNLKLYKADSSAVINATDGSYTADSHTLSINVISSVASSFDIITPSSAISGTAFSLSFTAKDAYTNTATTVASQVNLSVNHGNLSPVSIATASFATNGTYFNNFTISNLYVDTSATITIQSGSINQIVDIPVTGVDQMSYFTVSGSGTQTAGNSQQITITAIGLSGNAYANYTGNKNVVLSGASSIGTYAPTCTDRDGNNRSFGASSSLAFTNGVAHCDMLLYKAETTNVRVGDGTFSSVGHDLSVNVLPAIIHSFSGGAPNNVTSNVPFLLTLTAKDLYGNNTTDVVNDTTLSVDHGAFNTVVINPSGFQNNGTFAQNVTVGKIYVDTTVNLNIHNGNILNTAEISVIGVNELASFTVSGASAQMTAGASQIFTVTAMGGAGGVFTPYNGDKIITFSGASSSPQANAPVCMDKNGIDRTFGTGTTLTFTNGIAHCSMKLYKAETADINAGDGTYDAMGSTFSVTVSPAQIDSFSIDAPANAISGTPFSLSLSAKDQYGNTNKDVGNITSLSVNHGNITLASIADTNFQASGTYTGGITIYHILQDTTVVLTIQNGSIIQTKDISVTGVDEMNHFAVTGANAQGVGTTQTLTITAVSLLGDVFTGYSGDKIMIFSGASAVGNHIPTCTDKTGAAVVFGAGTTLTFANGVAHCNLKLYKAETADINATDAAYSALGHTLNIDASSGSLYGFNMMSNSDITSETPFSLTLTAEDAYGNPVTQVTNPVSLSVDSGDIDTTSIPGSGFQNDGIYIATVTISKIYQDKTVTLTLVSGDIIQTKNLFVKSSGRGGTFIPPQKPDIKKAKVVLTENGKLNITGIPEIAVQIAVSTTQDFKNASWEIIQNVDAILARFVNAAKLFIKFRGKGGGVSDVLIYDKKTSGGDTPLTIINDGDIVKTSDNPDVYIIKINNGKRYKRLILSPSVFSSYQHLKWSNIKVISKMEIDGYATSDLAKVANDSMIYQLFPDGDRGNKKVLDTNKPYDRDSVYEINAVDRESYKSVAG